MGILYSALSAGLIWGVVILIRETIRGFRLVATKRSVIICTVVYAVSGLFGVVTGIMGICTGLGSLLFLLLIGLLVLALAFGLVWKNFVKKGLRSSEPEAEVSTAEPEKKETPASNDKWVCPECGKENYGYARSCRCGAKKPTQDGNGTSS